ncbi:MAG: hypothetical protein FD126_3159, partial [Elusimicrobia bacterium]
MSKQPGQEPENELDSILGDLDVILQDMTAGGAPSPVSAKSAEEARARVEEEARRVAAEAA